MKDEDKNECLWKLLEKRHMEFNTKTTIDAEEWNRFCGRVMDSFADTVSMIALEYWYNRGEEE